MWRDIFIDLFFTFFFFFRQEVNVMVGRRGESFPHQTPWCGAAVAARMEASKYFFFFFFAFGAKWSS